MKLSMKQSTMSSVTTSFIGMSMGFSAASKTSENSLRYVGSVLRDNPARINILDSLTSMETAKSPVRLFRFYMPKFFQAAAIYNPVYYLNLFFMRSMFL